MDRSWGFSQVGSLTIFYPEPYPSQFLWTSHTDDNLSFLVLGKGAKAEEITKFVEQGDVGQIDRRFEKGKDYDIVLLCSMDGFDMNWLRQFVEHHPESLRIALRD